MDEKIIKENEKLKTEIRRLKQEMKKNKIEFETKNSSLNKILDLLNLISNENNLKKITQLILSYLNDIVPFDTATLILKKNNDFFYYQLIVKNDKKLFSTPKHENKLCSYFFYLISLNKKNILCKNLHEIENLTENNVNLHSTRSCFAIPILSNDKNENFILICESKSENIYTEKEIVDVENIFNSVYIIIKNALEFSNMSETILKDELTNLFNRKYFLLSLEKEIKQVKNNNSDFAIVMADIDCFKNINSNNTHLFGDKILERISKLLSKTLRNIDILARYGGEEFIILLPNTNASTALSICERLRKQIEKTTSLTISCGIASYKTGKSAMEIISHADLALAEAKKIGKNRVVNFDDII